MVNTCHPVPELSPNGSTLVDLLGARSLHQPEQPAFTFLQDGEIETAHLTYRELDQQSRAIAAQLQALGLCGERALLLYPPGLEYLAVFFGCLYAGVVAVPAYPPRNLRNASRILAIVSDAEAAVALTTTTILPKVRSLLAEKAALEELRWLTTDDLDQTLASDWQVPAIASDTLAFLQYTSGSTGTPKGVMLSHANLLHNAAVTYGLMGHSPESVFVSWLPVYHDMGLIGGILQPLYGGFPCILMPPAAFLQRPYRWLQAISQYRGTTSGAPNFAYELCIQKITAEQRQRLNLSSWRVAFNGAEPVRSQTLERFAAEFADCGFCREAFYPCYGMAETTLMVSGGHYAHPPVIQTVQKTALEQHRVVDAAIDIHAPDEIQSLVGCGRTIPQQQIVIAHSETLTRCASDEVGEIWVSGPSVGQGYWQRPEETAQIFRAYLADTGEGPFLRTGDLGFLCDGELFITGRAKDLIIIRGRNLYPQDIELTTERSHPALRSGGGAAFVVDEHEAEKLVVVQELEFRQQPDLEEVTTAIRAAIAQEHEVQVYTIVLIKPGTIPKTSSGKIQRRATRALLLAGHLEVMGSSLLEITSSGETPATLKRDTLLALPPVEGQMLLVSYLQALVAEVSHVSPSQVNPQQPIIALGLDSLKAFELKNRLEVDLQVAVSVADLFEHLNLSQLAIKILAQLELPEPVPLVSLAPVETASNFHPLSYAQQRLWFFEQLNPGSFLYNVPIALLLSGSLNVAALEQSLQEILCRHAALRTTFIMMEGKPVQVIEPLFSLVLPVVDLQKFPLSQKEEKVQQLATAETQQPFDLKIGPLVRLKLLKLGQEEHVFLLVIHHIVADGWSIGVFVEELAKLYEAFSRQRPSPLLELPIQYVDFALWQRQWLEGKRLQEQLTYWKQQLRGKLPVLELPRDYPRPPVQSFRGARQSFVFPKVLSDELKALSQQEGVTLFMTLLTAFNALLHHYTDQSDLIVGTDIANRTQVQVKSVIGFFVNQLVLRTNLSGNPTFRELLGQVRGVTVGAYAHQDLPFDKLVEALNPKRDLSHAPLFQVKFVLQNNPVPSLALSGLKLSRLDVSTGSAMVDLFLSLESTEQGLRGFLEYDVALFRSITIRKMLIHFEAVLSHIKAHPNTRLDELKALLAKVDRQQQMKEDKRLEAVSRQKLLGRSQKAVPKVGNFRTDEV